MFGCLVWRRFRWTLLFRSQMKARRDSESLHGRPTSTLGLFSALSSGCCLFEPFPVSNLNSITYSNLEVGRKGGKWNKPGETFFGRFIWIVRHMISCFVLFRRSKSRGRAPLNPILDSSLGLLVKCGILCQWHMQMQLACFYYHL